MCVPQTKVNQSAASSEYWGALRGRGSGGTGGDRGGQGGAQGAFSSLATYCLSPKVY